MSTERWLATDIDSDEYKVACKAAQVVSALAFGFFAMFLSFANSPGMEAIQQKPLLMRLEAVTGLCLLVSIFSAFFNFFQVTELDDVVLDNTGTTFVLDLARPIEWIFTCPLMQLALVIYGGSAIPTYRRILMPLLSVSVLVLGTTSMLTKEPDFLRYILAGIAFCIAMAMFALNRYQIVEYSNGKEDLWRGSADFWKISILLIFTWFPFPVWFLLSPEGAGFVTDVLVIQMGWAVLNIFSKISFMSFLQYCKNNAVQKKQTKVFDAIMAEHQRGGSADGKMLAIGQKTQAGVLYAVVTDALSQLGWGVHCERFLKLLKHAGIKTCDEMLMLQEAECDQKVLPWDMVTAVQQRLRKYQMEETDHCIRELEESEVMYNTPEGKAILKDRKGLDGKEIVAMVGKAISELFDQKIKAHEQTVFQHGQQMQAEFSELKQHIDNSMSSTTDRIERMEAAVSSFQTVLASMPAQQVEQPSANMAKQVESPRREQPADIFRPKEENRAADLFAPKVSADDDMMATGTTVPATGNNMGRVNEVLFELSKVENILSSMRRDGDSSTMKLEAGMKHIMQEVSQLRTDLKMSTLKPDSPISPRFNSDRGIPGQAETLFGNGFGNGLSNGIPMEGA